MKGSAVRLHPGQDLRLALCDYCVHRRIDAACIVTAVGSLTQAAIRFADAVQPTLLAGPFEILALSGTLSRHGAHLHIIVGDGAGQTRGGHLADGARIHTTAEVVLAELEGLAFERHPDPATGYRELLVVPRARD